MNATYGGFLLLFKQLTGYPDGLRTRLEEGGGGGGGGGGGLTHTHTPFPISSSLGLTLREWEGKEEGERGLWEQMASAEAKDFGGE